MACLFYEIQACRFQGAHHQWLIDATGMPNAPCPRQRSSV
ncbi:hypothetical protein [Azospirillum doebereinerae]